VLSCNGPARAAMEGLAADSHLHMAFSTQRSFRAVDSTALRQYATGRARSFGVAPLTLLLVLSTLRSQPNARLLLQIDYYSYDEASPG
jgi:hypothetical protein